MLANLKGSDFHGPSVIIVGAGAVGITLAVSMARLGWKVTILEQGGPSLQSDYWKNNIVTATGTPHPGSIHGRAAGLGGTTQLWGGQLGIFTPADLRPHYEDAPTWPLQYEEMLPWYRASLELLGVHQTDLDVGSLNSNKKHPARPPTGMEFFCTAWLPQPNFAKLFRRQLRDLDKSINIELYTKVKSLSFDNQGRVTEVEAEVAGGTQSWSADQIILAGGTISTIELLLRLQLGRQPCPFRRNTNVGRYFIDHLHVEVGELIPHYKPDQLSARFDHIYTKRIKHTIKLRLSESTLGTGLSNASITLNADWKVRSKPAPVPSTLNFAGLFLHQSQSLLAQIRIALHTIYRRAVLNRSTLNYGVPIPVGLELEQIPSQQSWCSVDQRSEQGVRLNWNLDGRESNTVQTACRLFGEYVAENGLGTFVPRFESLTGASDVLTHGHDTNHHMGGARMALTPESGVVDQNLLVYDTKNLSIAGASVFPTGSFANPTLTAIALGQRLAHHLTQRSANHCGR